MSALSIEEELNCYLEVFDDKNEVKICVYDFKFLDYTQREKLKKEINLYKFERWTASNNYDKDFNPDLNIITFTKK